MGFWNALSVLGPVGPALSEAQDIRTQRTQDAAKAAQEAESHKAQMTIQQLAAEGARQQNALTARDEQERQTVQQQLGIPLRKGKSEDGSNYTDYFTPTGVKRVADTPSNEARFKNYIDSVEKLGVKLTPEQKEAIAPEFYGVKPPPAAKFTPLPGAAGQPQPSSADPTGKSFVEFGRDETGNIVSRPVEAGYKPPEPKPGTPHAGLSHGRNAFGFFNPGKHQWQDAAGNAMPDFRPQTTFAETGLFEPMASYNPQTESIAMGSFNRRTGRLTFANGGGSSIPLPPAIAATIGKEFGVARDAQTRFRIMQQNAQEAYQGNQQAMVSLLMNHIGMTLGAQKGTHVSKATINDAERSAPWLETKLSSIGHRDMNGDFIYDGPKGGTNLTGQQVGQMVDLAKQRNDLQWQQVKDTGATYGVDLSGAIQQTQGATAPGPRAAGGKSAGGGGQITVTDPQGNIHHFDTQKQALVFKKLAGIK